MTEQASGDAPDRDAAAGTIRVLVAKLGLDGHDRGAKVVARILRDAGMEVVYTGLYKSPGEVVAAAVQEDVDVIGVSLLSGSHVPLFRELGRCLREEKADHIFVVAGGVIPEQDYAALWDSGVDAIVPQEARAELIVTTIRSLIAARGRV
ncbi:cobalamin B12-binding domain-containing protein [Mesorhizobium sp. M2C.T.Ca.TU.002.02.1.1]|uniref:cobalamin B12-binding domain-containing protein n=1 Tax=Mesorhizobium sp. M2C.T.Ca.TU.002.02.1.1 TaxID=2496788 RepID=UPI000FCCD0E9|nr:cobalamin B12-binding domain-containing protein [Mesorhizobium sp. M2C.T.Ca.TU.002.02.1.1]RUU57118.1 cobalamin B12-binding domain-containing protein [Mesorhizobium sp. M2C.T.Ca.TU.002.02.1.1]RUU71924.1 cobalamin B12-binding domain-containing protein [Mesorhizobium sp. M2C.T.Ca.TU.009.01.2.1]